PSEGRVRISRQPESPARYECERLDDHSRGLERGRKRLERELRPARAVEQSEPDGREQIHEVIGEGSPARFEFPSAQVLGRVADQTCLILLRRRGVLLEALIR